MENIIGASFMLHGHEYVILEEGMSLPEIQNYEYHIVAANKKRKEYVNIVFSTNNSANDLIAGSIILKFSVVYKFQFWELKPVYSTTRFDKHADPVLLSLTQLIGREKIFGLIDQLSGNIKSLRYATAKSRTGFDVSKIFLEGRSYILDYRTEIHEYPNKNERATSYQVVYEFSNPTADDGYAYIVHEINSAPIFLPHYLLGEGGPNAGLCPTSFIIGTAKKPLDGRFTLKYKPMKVESKKYYEINDRMTSNVTRFVYELARTNMKLPRYDLKRTNVRLSEGD